MVSLVKLALETGHFFYCLISTLTLPNLRRLSAIPIEKMWLDSLTAVLQTLRSLFQFQSHLSSIEQHFYWIFFYPLRPLRKSI